MSLSTQWLILSNTYYVLAFALNGAADRLRDPISSLAIWGRRSLRMIRPDVDFPPSPVCLTAA